MPVGGRRTLEAAAGVAVAVAWLLAGVGHLMQRAGIVPTWRSPYVLQEEWHCAVDSHLAEVQGALQHVPRHR